MKQVFGRRFWIYFAVTFVVVQMLVVVSAANRYTDVFISGCVSVKEAAKFCLLFSVGLMSVSLCSAAAVASFLSFRRLADSGRRGFLRTLATGLVFFLPLAVAICAYDWHAGPRVNALTYGSLWKMRRGPSPDAVGEKSYRDYDFANSGPSVMPAGKLRSTLDSLESQGGTLAGECESVLASLPEHLAEEAYDVYELKRMGVEYGYAAEAEGDPDSLVYVQRNVLYDRACRLAETRVLEGNYRFERFKRNVNAACLILTYLMFATLGYCLRRTSMKKILGVVAIVIVSVYMINGVIYLTESYAKQVKTRVR